MSVLFTTFTKVDSSNHIEVVNDSLVNINGVARNEDALLYFDYGAGYFSGDLTHDVTVNISSSDNRGDCNVWALANLVDDTYGVIQAGGDTLYVTFNRTNAGVNGVYLFECVGGVQYFDFTTFSFSTGYYLRINRNESIGANGTLYCHLYSDAARQNLIHTLSLGLHSKIDFRYLYAVRTYNDGIGAYQIFGSVSDMNLNEGIQIFRRRRNE